MQRLLLEPLPHAGHGQCLGTQDLHGDLTFEPLVERVEDACHATFAQDAVDAVATPDHRRGRARLHPGCLPRAALP